MTTKSQMGNPVTVVSSRFLASNELDLTIIRKPLSLSKGNFTVTNANGKVMFKVKRKPFNLGCRGVLLDDAGVPILSFRKQLWSFPTKWDVFRGNSKVSIFSAKQSSLIQPFKTSVDVFLGRTRNVCDFIVKGGWFEYCSCIVYAGDGTTIVAKMHKKHSVESAVLGKDRISVKVYPNVDHAFIVALVVILDQMNQN